MIVWEAGRKSVGDGKREEQVSLEVGEARSQHEALIKG